MSRRKKLSAKQRRLLGMDQGITRRDFLNATLLGAGAALLDLPAPLQLFAQTNAGSGYGGVGDYAASHGNTEEVISLFREIQDGKYNSHPDSFIDTKETFDLVVIGGGLSGLGAAYQFKKSARKGQKCLILENHLIFGGEAKRNEFIVNGQRLIGPQASNAFVVIDKPATSGYGDTGYEIFTELKIPKKYTYQSLISELKHLQFDRTNYGFMLWYDESPSVGYFFENNDNRGEAQWINNLWERKLKGSHYSAKAKEDFNKWRNSLKRNYSRPDYKQWLDSITYKDYLEKVMGLSPEIAKFADPVLAAALGLGCDAISAYAASRVAMPGFQGFYGQKRRRKLDDSDWHSFPGGNDGFSRYLMKAVIPDAISGSRSFKDIHNGRVDFEALDNPDKNIRMRLGATAVRIEHFPRPEKSEYVFITYVKGGKVFRLKARKVVMASGSWMNRRVVMDLPQEYKTAFKHFYHSSVVIINVALTNWRFLYKLGLTGCRWFQGFGYACNIRQSMIVGDYQPPLHPDKPCILTFYIPFLYPGLQIQEQGVKGRKEILATSFSEYERKIREQMIRLFGKAGFDPKKDIAGIILNRWLYGFLNPQPGFFFGRDGKPAPREVIRKRFGRISFGHSELSGHQNWTGAIDEGRRAAKQVMEIQ
jgi:spermidine dehydrogenase